MPPRSYLPALDGVRGIAILLVILLHYGEILGQGGPMERDIHQVFEAGWCGVDLFFVLSGFLITGILLDSKYRPDYFQRFYWRRAVRIFPLYFLFLGFIFIILRYVYRHYIGHDLWQGTNPWWYVTYLCNWKPNHADGDAHISHFWSLAVEEQFYLIWPAVVLLCTRRRLAAVAASLAGAALVLRCVMLTAHASSAALYRLTPTRMDPLVMGALIALIVRNEAWREKTSKLLLPLAAGMLVAIGALAWRLHGFDFGQPLVATAGTSAVAILFACVVFHAAVSTGGFLHSFFLGRWLGAIGRYSYCIYVVHLAPHLMLFHHVESFIERRRGVLQPLLRFSYIGGLFAFVFAISWCSWRVIESPLLRWKDRLPAFPSKKRTPAMAAS